MSVSWARPKYNEYATCYLCGLKKYCIIKGCHFVCYACDTGNFKGLKRIKETRK